MLPVTLLERWPQVYRVKITFGLLLNNWFVSTKTDSIKCFVNWIPLNTHARFNKPQPYLKSSGHDVRQLSSNKKKVSKKAACHSVTIGL